MAFRRAFVTLLAGFKPVNSLRGLRGGFCSRLWRSPKIRIIFGILLVLFGGYSFVFATEDFKFDVYYQMIYDVEKAPFPPQPKGKLREIFDPEHDEELFYPKKPGKSGKTPRDTVYVPPDPKTGTGTLTIKDFSNSEPIPKYRYRMTRVKVKDEEHLLQLMGAMGKVSWLSDGQRALLASYRETQNPKIQEMMKMGPQPKVNLVLVDTNGLESKFPKEIATDFWPHAWLNRVTIGSYRYQGIDAENEARATFWHETGHTVDKTQVNTDDYGLDKQHNFNEHTSARMAFIEGWASYRGFLRVPSQLQRYRNTLGSIRYETSTPDGKSFKVDERSAKRSVSAKDLLAVEGINAVIFYRISQEIPNGEHKILESFFATNKPERSLTDFLKHLVASNPDSAAKIAKILDQETYGKMTNDEMLQFLGDTFQTREYLKTRKERNSLSTPKFDQQASSLIKQSPGTSIRHGENGLSAPEFGDANGPVKPTKAKVDHSGSNPFGD